ncbi:hypothetical protein Tco_0710575 [Tanacetum coccineum]
MPNTPNSRFTPQRPTQTGFERRSSFKKGVYYGNCGKKVICKKNVTRLLDQASQDKASTSGQATAPSEDHDQSKQIALGNLCDGLYFLSSPPKISATTSTILHSSRGVKELLQLLKPALKFKTKQEYCR